MRAGEVTGQPVPSSYSYLNRHDATVEQHQVTGFEPQKRSVCLPGASDGGHTHPVTTVSPRQPCVHARTDAQARGHAIIIVSPRPVAHGRRCRPGAPWLARSRPRAPGCPQPFSRHPGRGHVRPRATPGGVFLSLLVSSFQRAIQPRRARTFAVVGGLRSVPSSASWARQLVTWFISNAESPRAASPWRHRPGRGRCP